MTYVKALGQSYAVDEKTGDLVFADGIRYTVAEALELARGGAKTGTIRAVHQIKKLFDGEIVSPAVEQARKRKNRRTIRSVKGSRVWEP